MDKQTLIAVAVVVVALGAGAFWYLSGGAPLPPGQQPQQSGASPGGQAQLANPASVNCVQALGGQLEIAEGPGGAIGLCHLPDGRVCEEWSLLRNEGCVNPLATSTPQAASTTPAR